MAILLMWEPRARGGDHWASRHIMHHWSRACQQFLGFGWPPFGIVDLHEATIAGMSRFLTIGVDWWTQRPDSLLLLFQSGFVIGRLGKESHCVGFGCGDTYQELGLLLVYDGVTMSQRWYKVDGKNLWV